jgi:hypothetical protein
VAVTPLAWIALGVLACVTAVAVVVGVPVWGLALVATVLGLWVAAGYLVRRDARRLGFTDPDVEGSTVLVWGGLGLLLWFGVRRRAAIRRSDSGT